MNGMMRRAEMRRDDKGQATDGFDQYSIFYDEERDADYGDYPRPVGDNVYQPFLSNAVALSILAT